MDQPIACTLAPDRRRRRIQELYALARSALLVREPIAGGERLVFTADDATERRLRAAVAAEQQCCAFLAFALARDHDHLVLHVTGPAQARPVVEQLFAEVSPGRSPRRSSRRRPRP